MTADQVAKMFSARIIRELARQGSSPLLGRVINRHGLNGMVSESATISSLLESAFQSLKLHGYRNEYSYKSALVSEHKSAVMITEFRVGDCKADFVVLNESATAFEIKSERDNLSKIERQVNAYRKCFATVNVIAGENHIGSVFKLVPKDVGVLKLSGRYEITTIREAACDPGRTDPATIFDSIQLKEAKMILEEFGIEVPNVPNTKLYAELRNCFIKLDSRDAHDGMVKTLKKTRGINRRLNNIPKSLRAIALSTPLCQRDYERLVVALKTPVSDAARWG